MFLDLEFRTFLPFLFNFLSFIFFNITLHSLSLIFCVVFLLSAPCSKKIYKKKHYRKSEIKSRNVLAYIGSV